MGLLVGLLLDRALSTSLAIVASAAPHPNDQPSQPLPSSPIRYDPGTYNTYYYIIGALDLSQLTLLSSQVKWINETGVKTETPPNSRNPRKYCAKCNDYLGEDVTRTLGALALPVHLAESKGQQHVHESYRPNHHIFYDDRVEDAVDDLPKWKTVPQGDLSDADGRPSKAAKLPSTGNYDAVTGQYNKDYLPISPTRAPDPQVYHFTEVDPIPNHVTSISTGKVSKPISRS